MSWKCRQSKRHEEKKKKKKKNTPNLLDFLLRLDVDGLPDSGVQQEIGVVDVNNTLEQLRMRRRVLCRADKSNAKHSFEEEKEHMKIKLEIERACTSVSQMTLLSQSSSG